MRTVNLIDFAVASFVLVAGLSGLSAQTGGGPPADNPGKGRPGVAIDEEKSPLQKEIEAAVGRKKQKEERDNPACKRAIDENDQEAIARVCKFPGVRTRKLSGVECPECGDVLNPGGKVVGKKIRTETVLEYREPGQKHEGKERWDRVKIDRSSLGEIGHGAFNAGRPGVGGAETNGARVREAVLFPESAVNEDRDCIDRVTGERKGGLVPDGDSVSCFDAAGALKRTLSPAAGGCVHENGTALSGSPDDGVADDCYDEDGVLKTSLEELVDEDGPEELDNDRDGMLGEDPEGDADGDGNPNDDNDCIAVDGRVLRGVDCFDAGGAALEGLAALIDEDGEDAIDQDGDGRIDEDPQAADLDDACRDFGTSRGLKAGLGDVTADGGCDLTRALIVAGNKKAMEDPAIGQKIFQADDDGNPDPGVAANHPKAVEIGKEMRRIKVIETFSLACKEGSTLAGGQCVDPPEEGSGSAAAGSGGSLLSEAEVRALASGDSRSIQKYVMMGFTFAPPVPQWGYRVEEEACVDLGFTTFCYEVFFARIGYEFDIAMGLRLPVEVNVSGVPDPSIRAGSPLTLQTSVQPLDFTQKQYKDFCGEHRLDRERFISDCERFSFPEFIDSFNPLTPAEQKDGSEFVAANTTFAGVIVRVLSIPVIQWGIDSSIDLATACTMLKIKDKSFNLLSLGLDIIEDGNIKQALKNSGANCASFTTPFGQEPDPLNPLLMQLRTFPLDASFDVRADCAEALVRGETITVKGKVRPICTGMLLGYNGASLGIGLGLEASAGSKLIRSSWQVQGDADPAANNGDTSVRYVRSRNEGPEAVEAIGPVVMDNYSDRPFQSGGLSLTQDDALMTLSEFTYFLNAIQLTLKAKFEFGGILTPIPDLASFNLFSFNFDVGEFGPQFSQHAGTENILIPARVDNHALAVDVSPRTSDPALRVDDHTLRIRPGEFGQYLVSVENLGSVEGGFDRFAAALSNAANQSLPLTFAINPNTDFDCVDAAGAHFAGNPNDGVPDDCFAADGRVRPDRAELIDEDPVGPAGGSEAQRDQDGDGVADEDPPEQWLTLPDAAGLAATTILGVPAHSGTTPPPDGESFVLAVSPFKHPLTAPGLYPFRVTGDSIEARLHGLAAEDPLGQARTGAADVAFIEVTSFFDPQIRIAPAAASSRPGIEQVYALEAGNGANVRDTLLMNTSFIDFNQAGCNLTTLGGDPQGCPYRAFPTVIPADAWTTAGDLPAQVGPLDPLGIQTSTLRILVPRDWAGMQDATYQYVTTVMSLGDPGAPPARDFVVVAQTVQATAESMTRYLDLEIDALIVEIERANAQGIATGGLLPLLMHPVRMTNDGALADLLAGNGAGAARSHNTNIRIMEGFLFALEGASGDGVKIPEPFVSDWRARARAILTDLAAAAASATAS
jgi:hypothetical protein